MRRTIALVPLVAALAGLGVVTAQAHHTPAARALAQANAAMHHDMAIEMTDDADVDFVRSMIPHHRGAVEMARIVLEYGTDPEIRKLAEGIVAAQEGEIAFMEKWLASKGIASESDGH